MKELFNFFKDKSEYNYEGFGKASPKYPKGVKEIGTAVTKYIFDNKKQLVGILSTMEVDSIDQSTNITEKWNKIKKRLSSGKSISQRSIGSYGLGTFHIKNSKSIEFSNGYSHYLGRHIKRRSIYTKTNDGMKWDLSYYEPKTGQYVLYFEGVFMEKKV